MSKNIIYELIEHHTRGHNACNEFRSFGPSSREASRLAAHYRARAKWHLESAKAIEKLEKAVQALKDAALDVLAARDSDDSPQGDPRHCHNEPGVWDGTTKACESCAAYNRLAFLVAGGVE
jgi:hypothetical protein